MKQQEYELLKMLEGFKSQLINLYNGTPKDELNYAIDGLVKQYNELIKNVFRLFPSERLNALYTIEDDTIPATYEHESRLALVSEMVSCLTLAINFLRSQDMDINKELEEKQRQLKLQTEEVERLRKLLKDAFDALKEFPEMQRSKFVEEMKKSHRAIEHNQNPKKKDGDI